MLMTEWDLGDAIAVAREEAWEDGRAEGRAEGQRNTLVIARNLLEEGSTPDFVQKITGLPPDEIERLQRYN
jgi:predicted transposase YdaD